MATPISLLVNGRYLPLCYSEFQNFHHGFSSALRQRAVVEDAFHCRFIMVKTSVESGLVHLVAHPSTEDNPTRLDNLPPTVLWHTGEGSAANMFLEAWVMNAAPAQGLDNVSSIYDFWLEYKASPLSGSLRPVLLKSIERFPSVEQDGVDAMINEEANKVSASRLT